MIPFFLTISTVSGVVGLFKNPPHHPIQDPSSIMKEVGDREHDHSKEENAMSRYNASDRIERKK